jgi:hypothetical protein
MKQIIDFLSGKKTYVACGAIFALTLCYWQGWIKLPEEIGKALTSGAITAVPIIFLRAGVSKSGPGSGSTSALIGFAIALSALGIFSGVMLSGCGTTSLDPAGYYAGMPEVFALDETLANSKDAMDGFLEWEAANHEVIETKWPDVTKAADAIRTNAPTWFSNAESLRGAYVELRASAKAGSAPLIVASNAFAAEVSLIEAHAGSLSAITNATGQVGNHQ